MSTSRQGGGGGQPGASASNAHEADVGPAESANDQKRSGRRSEGPAHARKASAVQTLKRTVTEFQEDNLTDWAAA